MFMNSMHAVRNTQTHIESIFTENVKPECDQEKTNPECRTDSGPKLFQKVYTIERKKRKKSRGAFLD